MFDLVISIVVLAAIALFGGAVFLHRKGETRRAMLMAVLAFIMVINAAIWLVPVEGGGSLGDVASTE